MILGYGDEITQAMIDAELFYVAEQEEEAQQTQDAIQETTEETQDATGVTDEELSILF